MSVKLYGIDGSPNVRGAMLGLAEKGVEFELVSLMPPAWKTPEHLARNPFGKVPVLDHDGFEIFETQAILRYVDETFPGPALQPANAREAARMNQIIGIIDCYLGPSWIGGIAFERLVAPTFLGQPTDMERINAVLPMAQSCAETLEALIAAPYLTGETFSLADIRLMPHFDWLRKTPEGEAMLAGKNKLAKWFDHVSRRQSAKEVLQQ
jgi:glutathione S-transferase